MAGHQQCPNPYWSRARVKFNTIRPQWRVLVSNSTPFRSDSTPLSLDRTSLDFGNPQSRAATCVHGGRSPPATPDLWLREASHLHGHGVEAWLGPIRGVRTGMPGLPEIRPELPGTSGS
ncbi:hypothetical protein EUGRSUZ_E03178 [Eucalyptus grandis]|uniref:Uncharacterized protein n=2 Tax=Eucalyptus grandis TaxID=71139 RepID=A0ACC3KXX7_EUCGR|nr:hypothetical protein EUGRSUZ_E03178 [Eucalyptus grandis]